MNFVYGISLAVGVVAVVTWVVIAGLSEARGGRPVHPDERFGGRGRGVVAGLSAFGIAGLSASYGGWPTWAAVAAALVAAAVFIVYASRAEAGRASDPD